MQEGNGYVGGRNEGYITNLAFIDWMTVQRSMNRSPTKTHPVTRATQKESRIESIIPSAPGVILPIMFLVCTNSTSERAMGHENCVN